MKHLRRATVAFTLMLLSVFLVAGCSETKEVSKSTEESNTKDTKEVVAASEKGNKLELSVPDSKLEWTGKKVTGQHNGTVEISGGELFVDKGKLTGGKFEINFSTIKNLDIEDAESNSKLVNHLKSDDFFSADKFPVGMFEVTSVTPLDNSGDNNYSIGGNLTIKGITNAISFPAKVNISGNTVTASADFKIDRTLWDVKFRSGKFFENLGDKLISDDIELKIQIAAK